jgi:hypothetical protein
MGYYIRLFSPCDDVPQFEYLKEAAEYDAPFTLTLDAGEPNAWEQLLLAHADGTPIATVERNPTRPGELGADEVKEVLEDWLPDARPASAAAWLRAYLPGVRCIYAFRVLSGAERADGWSALYELKLAIGETAGGILHADSEGFSNEQGYQITWEFADDVTGDWQMAVLRDGQWATFRMDLANRSHREAFLRGEVPEGAEPVDG